MTHAGTRFHFDFADPLSWAMLAELRAAEAHAGETAERVPLELRAPPGPLLDPRDGEWLRLLERAREVPSSPAGMQAPRLLPWTRKAHELALLARSEGRGEEAIDALFGALLAQGRDIGRIDVLVDVADALGLDRSRAKAALDVDRFAEDVTAAARTARALGVDAPPALTKDGRVLRGFHDRGTLGTFLRSP